MNTRLPAEWRTTGADLPDPAAQDATVHVPASLLTALVDDRAHTLLDPVTAAALHAAGWIEQTYLSGHRATETLRRTATR